LLDKLREGVTATIQPAHERQKKVFMAASTSIFSRGCGLLLQKQVTKISVARKAMAIRLDS